MAHSRDAIRIQLRTRIQSQLWGSQAKALGLELHLGDLSILWRLNQLNATVTHLTNVLRQIS